MRQPPRSDRPVASVPAAGSPSTDLSRRRFLRSLGAGGAGAAAVAVSGVPGVAAAQAAPVAQAADTSGYRETAHVRDYYRTAKL